MNRFFLLLLLLPSVYILAQQPRPMLHLGAGASIPLFEYKSPSLSEGCFTQSGLSVSFGASVPLFENWGIAAKAAYQLHSVDVSRLGYEKVQADPFLLDLTIRSEPYRVLSFVAGPTFTTKNVSGFRLQMAALAGYLASRSPHQIYKPTYFMTGPEYFEITTSLDRSFAWGGAALLYYSITSCYEIGVETEFLRSDAAFGFYTGTGDLRVDKRTISMLNIKLSLLLKLPPLRRKSIQ